MKPNMKKKFDFSAEMNEAESIKATPKNEYLEEEKRLLKENIKELASLNDNVHYIITNLDNLLEFLREYKVAIAQGTQEQAEKFGQTVLISSFTKFKTNVMKLSEKSVRLTAIFSYHTRYSIS